MNKKFLVFVMLFSFGVSSYASVQSCDAPGFQFCRGGCRPAAECNRNNPPPPGLVVPIDSNFHLLLAAGLGLGIYFFGFQKKGLARYSALSKIKNK